jgi:flagellin
MAMVVNSNIASENTQRLLEEVSRNQMRSMERLTTGLRVNSARDDASGFSVVNNMTRQIQGIGVATTGANDGINMLQTADQSLSDSTELLQRMRELGLQSMTSTYTSAQRGDMDAEFQQLNAELSRLASNTKFNNQQLLKGATFSLQAGWETEATNKIQMSGFLLASVQADVKTMANASQAVVAISGRMQSIQTHRAKWGAVVTRVENAISGMNRLEGVIKESRSRWLDTDYAKESANLAKTQVFQQAGMAMMAQSNQSTQNVLSLLR